MKFPTERPHFWLFAVLALVGLAADQASKYVVFAKLYPSNGRDWEMATVVPGYFDLRTAYTELYDAGDEPLSLLRTLSGERLPHVNRGALFGVGNGNGDGPGMNTVFAVISLAAACFIIFWVARPTVARDRWLCVALGLIFGGTLGNLYDRIVFGGVRDFLHWYYTSEGKTHNWPDFNVADCCLVCGAGVLLLHSFLVKDPAGAAAPTALSAAEAAPMQTTAPTPSA